MIDAGTGRTASVTLDSVAALHAVTFRYPEARAAALRQSSWVIEDGGFQLVIGRSGSGKSTLLRCLNGLVPHHSGGAFGGQGLVTGLDTRYMGPRDLSAVVGFVFQDPESQLFTTNVASEIAFSLEQHGVESSRMKTRVEEMLDLLGIAHLRDRHPDRLSGGERQRVAIAAALALHPRLLVLDEPTSQLDPLGAEDVFAALSRLNDDLGLTVVVSEHRLERVFPLADRIRWMRDPEQPAVDGTPREIAAVLDPVALPAVTQLGRRIGHHPLPLSVNEGRALATKLTLPGQPQPSSQSSGGDLAISAKGITVGHGDRAVLVDVSLEVRYGEFVALMGRNGSGKTTLMRALMGLAHVMHGSVAIADTNVRAGNAHDLRGQVGYLPQLARSLFFKERVIEELRFTVRSRKADSDIDAVIERFDVSELLERHPLDLSGGERERVAIATIMAGGPQILLLDEPTRGMDAWRKTELARLLTDLQREGVAVIMATHDVELVASCASRVVMLGDRTIIADGPPREVLSGSLAFSTQINRIFGGTWLTVRDLLPEPDSG